MPLSRRPFCLSDLRTYRLSDATLLAALYNLSLSTYVLALAQLYPTRLYFVLLRNKIHNHRRPLGHSLFRALFLLGPIIARSALHELS